MRIISGHVQHWSRTRLGPWSCRQDIPAKGSRRGAAYAYNVKALRDKEMLVAAQAMRSYEHFTA